MREKEQQRRLRLQRRQRHSLRKREFGLRPVDAHAVGLDIRKREAVRDVHLVYLALRGCDFRPDGRLYIFLCKEPLATEKLRASLKRASV